jgi:antitoxin component HigA of HigAB toxin-antitoxin module
MKVLITTPMAPISERISSHRAAQAAIYADQLRHSGHDVTVNYGGKIEDYNDFECIAVYHGNDWGGTVNLFGGVKQYGSIDQIVRLSKFTGKVFSLVIDFPKYSEMIKPRVDKEPASHPDWKSVDWTNLAQIETFATVINPNQFLSTKLAFGDSHAISMYRPGWKVNSVPFKTLHGALNMGLESFVPDNTLAYSEFEVYFGNIDIRHHLLRQPDPIKATKALVAEYVKQCQDLSEKGNAKVTIWEPLPIENESRKLPKTGYYKDAPFYGSWNERNEIRKLFVRELEENVKGNVCVFKWVSTLMNHKEELDFAYMEKPQSVHLSREFYPHWNH